MTVTTRLYTYFRGQQVGTDAFGNRYFQEKSEPKGRRRRRWVLYLGNAEPSKIPPEWHGWMHYTTDVPPPKQQPRPHYIWEKQHLPNLTGTTGAYAPPGHLLKGGQHAPTTSEYEAWKP